jgi:hypothetical protein
MALAVKNEKGEEKIEDNMKEKGRRRKGKRKFKNWLKKNAKRANIKGKKVYKE